MLVKGMNVMQQLPRPTNKRKKRWVGKRMQLLSKPSLSHSFLASTFISIFFLSFVEAKE